MKIVVWVLRVVLGLLFLFTGMNKLLGSPMMVQVFQDVGIGQWFRYVVGLIEVGGAVLTVWPKWSVVGAAILFFVAVGAFIAQVGVLHKDWIHTVVLAALTGLLAYLQRADAPSIKAANRA